MNLEPTGERMILEHYRSSPQDYVIYLLHLATYRFAEDFARGKRVLDYGCGSGYGSAQIAEVAREVTAVDVAEDAIHYARERFQRSNLRFQAIDPGAPLPFDDASFDTVLSFQVFEHVADSDRYLAEIRRVLAPGGKLVLVTPDRSTRLLPLQRPWNRWHLHEYGRIELDQCVRKHFPHVEVLGMGGKPEVIDIEIKRCRKIKWMTLPFTLPIMPDAWRVAALNMIHRLRGAESRVGQPRDYPFEVSDITIGVNIEPSVNLVVVAS
jgi:SAM-dependent methyltransferase